MFKIFTKCSLVALALILALSICACAATRNSLMYKGDSGHTGSSTEQLTYPLKLAWKAITEVSPDNPSSPAVSDGVVYLASGDHMYAVDAATGTIKWRYPADTNLSANVKTSPAVGDDLVYYGCSDGILYAITKDKGSLAWSFATKASIVSSPTIVDGILYFGSGDNHLYALDARTGKPIWHGGFKVRDEVTTSPAIDNGSIYFLSNDAFMYSIYTGSGAIKWSVRVGVIPMHISPVVGDGMVFLPADGRMRAYQTQSGVSTWSMKLPGDVTTVPAYSNGTLYFACNDNKLYALDVHGGWKWKTPIDLHAPVHGSPIVMGKTLIIGANKGALVAIDTETGKIKWNYTILPSETQQGKLDYANVACAPVAVNGALYVLSDDGTLSAFRSDFPDNTPPQILNVWPTLGSVINGNPPVQIIAKVSEPGSGIDAASIKMYLDSAAVDFKTVDEQCLIWYKTPRLDPIVPLSDGSHQVRLVVSDWAGNKTDYTWGFMVDNTVRTTPQPTTPTQPAPGMPGPGGMPGGMPGMPGMPGPGMPGMPRIPGGFGR
jgi:outer membrane protein assembly factor BamB